MSSSAPAMRSAAPVRSVGNADDAGGAFARAAALRVERLGQVYAGRSVLDSVSWQADAAEILCLLGHSGSGKTTLLRLIAGLEVPCSGRVLIGGEEVSGPACFVAPERRDVGLVFQDYALFPHLSVLGNVMFGLRTMPRAQARATALRTLERVGMSRHADSRPHTLSGGEQQRVALARALAPSPRVLLMDEPFSNLDRRTRDRVRGETMELLRESATTAIVVTHDPEEALRIADRIVLLREGRVEQIGDPRAFWETPASLFAARFFSDWNEIEGVCRDGVVSTPLGRFPAPHLADGAAARVCIRPQALRVADSGFAVTVTERVFLGDSEQLRVVGRASPLALTVQVPAHADAVAGQVLHLHADAAAVRVFGEPESP